MPKSGGCDKLSKKIITLNAERKLRRKAEKKKLRNLFDIKRMPKIFLVCDPESAPWMISQLDPKKSLLVIDEPPMGSDSVPANPEDNPVSFAMTSAMLNPMYKTILMSATMPRSYQLPTLVSNFCTKFDCKEENSIKECFSTQLDRGVILVRPNVKIAFPHELCETVDDLKALASRLPGDPLTLKAYTERALSQLLVRWKLLEKAKIAPSGWKPPQKAVEKFADLSYLKPDTIREYTCDLLVSVAEAGSDEFVKEFCSSELSEKLLAVANDDEDDTGSGTSAQPFPSYDTKEMLFSNAYAFPGVTLVADDEPSKILEEMAERLIEQFPKMSEVEKDADQKEAAMASAQKQAEKALEKGGADAAEAVEFYNNSTHTIKIDSSLILHTEQFLKRWCPNYKKGEGFLGSRMVPNIGDYKAVADLPVDDKWKMLALSGAGAFDPKLDEDPLVPTYTHCFG